MTLLGYFARRRDRRTTIDKYLLPIIGAIIVISLIPPFIEWRKSKKKAAVRFTEAQAEAEAAALHDIVEDD